jgi:hypothetical protein
MNLCPCFNEPELPLRKSTINELDRVDRNDADLVLIVGVDMGPMMGRGRLSKHANDDAKEPGELGHRDLKSQARTALNVRMRRILSSISFGSGPLPHNATVRFRLSGGQRVDMDTRVHDDTDAGVLGSGCSF